VGSREDRLGKLESSKPDKCPDCNGGLLVREFHADGTITYPEAQPCSTCGNRKPGGAISFIEIDLTGTNQRPRDDGDTENE
jgi:hypothetical protein